MGTRSIRSCRCCAASGDVAARGLLEPSIASGRDRYRRETRVFREPPTQVGEVRGHYVDGTGTTQDAPRIPVINGATLSAAPPAVVTLAGCDILDDEGEACAEALPLSGRCGARRAFLRTGAWVIHLTGVCASARRAMLPMAEEWRALLERYGS